jgi:hypothetical protein
VDQLAGHPQGVVGAGPGDEARGHTGPPVAEGGQRALPVAGHAQTVVRGACALLGAGVARPAWLENWTG